jgi:hypothetical protein
MALEVREKREREGCGPESQYREGREREEKGSTNNAAIPASFASSMSAS